MTSFGAMSKCAVGIIKLLHVSEKDRYLSYLPVAHGMERWLGEVRIFLYAVMSANFNDITPTNNDLTTTSKFTHF